MLAPTERFSSRVDDYIRYRPGYPEGIIDLLRGACGLTPASVIADLGSGTGKLAELFLRQGNAVYGVEPNHEMREAGERLLAVYLGFTSIDAPAEATTLADQSVDFITAGQAFHWFDQARARIEFARILRPGGWVILVWNERRSDSLFLQAYEDLLRTYATDYEQVNHRNVDETRIRQVLGLDPFLTARFDNAQVFDFDGLKGRLLSSSYAPEAGHPKHEPMLAALAALFTAYQVKGRVTFTYDTQVYYGQLAN